MRVGGRNIASVMFGRLVAASFCVALWTACNCVSAYAHATLLQTEPPSGGQLDEIPDAVRLYFNERVETIFNSIEVLDRDSRRVDIGSPRVIGGGDTLEVGLNGLKQGPYTVRWRVNSLDGHQVQGHYGLGVQSPPPTEAEMNNLSVPQQSASTKLLLLFVKWLALAAMMTWLGGVSFWILIFEPCIPIGWQTGTDPQPLLQETIQRTCTIIWVAALLFFLAELLALVGQGMTFADIPFIKAFSPTSIETVLTKTSYGYWWIARMLAALGLLALSGWRMRPSILSRNGSSLPARSKFSLPVGSALMGAIMLLTIPMRGHARAVSRATAVAVAFDWGHMAGTAIWIGGLVFLWAIVMLIKTSGAEESEFLSNLLGRFSRMARICVLVLLVTGAYAAWLHIPTWRSFISTEYGLALLIKLLLVTAILLIAAVNWRRVLPALAGFSRQPDIYRKWAGRFRSLIANEAVLGIAVLAVVAILTSLPPAAAVAMAGPIELSKPNQNMIVNLKLDSTRVGTVHSLVTIRDSTGRTIPDSKSATLFVRMLDMDMGLETIEAQPAAGGSFQADIPLTMAGKWSISVQISPQTGDAFVTEFDISSSSLQ